MTRKKLVLIDGNSIANRAFYGLPDMTNAQGEHTGAIYGFLNILFRILSEEEPQYLAVAFDLHAPTFRHKMYDAYKGTRKPMPTELREQMPVLRKLLAAMQISVVTMEGYEADDILGTLARQGEAAGMDVSLVSGDRDLLQIATEAILIRIPKTKAGKTEIEDYHTQEVVDRYGITPAQVIELKALMGDSSDNIPGVPKIGEKTATALVQEYGTIENLKAHIGEITKNAVRETLSANFELAELSKKLATIDTAVPLTDPVTSHERKDPYTQEAYEIIKRLGFKKILAQFEQVSAGNGAEEHFRIVSDLAEAENLFDACSRAKKISFRFLYEGAEVFGLSLCAGEEDVCFLPAEGLLTGTYLTDRIRGILTGQGDHLAYTFDIKQQLSGLDLPIETVEEHIADCALAAYLLNPLKSDYDVEDIANEHLSLIIKGQKERFGKQTLFQAYEEDPDNVRDYACYLAYVCFRAGDVLLEKLKNTGMDRLFSTIEMPLTVCLSSMEREGVLVRREELEDNSARLAHDLSALEETIYREAGEAFNINSPKQLGEILFEKMGLPGGKKTKTGYSTAADVLEKLAPDHPFVAHILRYRTIAKLRSTYAEGLTAYIADDGRIHSTFHQTITATGRLSSADPNLQNIPIRMEEGRLIRKAFVPREGCVFVDADYSQIELRIMAHMSGDEKLIDAYRRADDIHAITASEVFHVPLCEVTPLQRRNAKAVNFGIIYGISSFGLSQDLSISRAEAAGYIERYFETYPQVKAFIDRLVSSAKETGYAQTLYGRRRPIPELSSNVFMQRSFGERVAMNAPIQGTAADIMKIAMLRIFRRLQREGLKSRMILQVHDEVLIEAPRDEVKSVHRILEEEMTGAAQLAVKLEVDMHDGTNWYDAK
ncbi:MAG: DNA polymerase I [Lachnospiraceae bacterium]|nr:DNA polymerase I [Lachnospiraceae bacterium]